jgi:hypothetical protein
VEKWITALEAELEAKQKEHIPKLEALKAQLRFIQAAIAKPSSHHPLKIFFFPFLVKSFILFSFFL